VLLFVVLLSQVRASGEIDLGQLHRVHHVYKSVVHDHTGVTEGSVALHRILNKGPLYNPWQRVLIAFFCCGTICMLEFDGSFVDGVNSYPPEVTTSFQHQHINMTWHD
jgi:uncharacterized membrane protein YjjP (DUF1212 family)